MTGSPYYHANLPNDYAEWLMNLVEFRANDYGVERTPDGVRLPVAAFDALADLGDNDDGVIRSHPDDGANTHIMWIGGDPYTVIAEPTLRSRA